VSLLESFATFLLVFVVLSVAVEPTGNSRFAVVAPLAIGLSLYVAADSTGRWTGGSLNPARFIGSAVAGGCSGQWKHAWAYLLGELTGALAAVAVHVARNSVRHRIVGASACLRPINKGAPAQPPPAKAGLQIGRYA
jgi:glycerol uptake facilitator-like aquaporin